MQPPFGPELISFGALGIHWYGVFAVTGIILGANVATYLAGLNDENPEHIWDMLFVAVILGIIGARLEYVLIAPHWDYYKEHIAQIFMIWGGGLRIYGALIGGVVGVLIYAYWQKVRPWRLLDFAAPGMALGQAIGRWGNFINMELYGPPTTLPWGLKIPAFNRIAPYTDLQRYPESLLFHPAFLYESLMNLGLCLLLLWVSIKFLGRLKQGDIVLGYLIGYSMIRFFMDFLRTDGTSVQLLALSLVILGGVFLVLRHTVAERKSKAG